MEKEEEDYSDPGSGVRISITRASWSEEDEQDPGNPSTREHTDSSLDEGELDKMSKDEEEKEQLVDEQEPLSRSDTSGADGVQHSSTAAEEDEEVSRAFENGVSISGDDPKSHADTSDDKEDESEAIPTSPQVEVVGDRVLIERDGKFELVDVKEIKAEYFDMLGISPDADDKFEQPDSNDSTVTDVSESHKSPEKKVRPKTTTLDELLRRNEKKQSPPKTRSKSAKTRSRRDEFAHIKSPYGMTEQQIEIKRKREEAIARRKKEEDERRREEARRKREDAERAFEAWLNAKKEEAKERQEEEEKRKADPNLQTERALSAQSAYEKWLNDKRAQTKVERQYERSRREDEAAQYLIRDRRLCDEAFRRWIKKKNTEARAKSASKKKRKPKLKRKEQPPHNSDRIRYYEYYGYRNTVVH